LSNSNRHWERCIPPGFGHIDTTAKDRFFHRLHPTFNFQLTIKSEWPFGTKLAAKDPLLMRRSDSGFLTLISQTLGDLHGTK
jgi:hypothetical protein